MGIRHQFLAILHEVYLALAFTELLQGFTLKLRSSSRFIQDMGKCFAEIKTEDLQQRVNHRISGCTFWFARGLHYTWKTIRLGEFRPMLGLYNTWNCLIKLCVSLGSHK